MQNKHTELLPCPFCGGAEIGITTDTTGGFFVSCTDCLVVQSYRNDTPFSKQQATKAWNTRAHIQTPAENERDNAELVREIEAVPKACAVFTPSAAADLIYKMWDVLEKCKLALTTPSLPEPVEVVAIPSSDEDVAERAYYEGYGQGVWDSCTEGKRKVPLDRVMINAFNNSTIKAALSALPPQTQVEDGWRKQRYEELYTAVLDVKEFIEEITLAGGKYKDLNGNQIVADAYKELQKLEKVAPNLMKPLEDILCDSQPLPPSPKDNGETKGEE